MSSYVSGGRDSRIPATVQHQDTTAFAEIDKESAFSKPLGSSKKYLNIKNCEEPTNAKSITNNKTITEFY